MNNNIKRAIFGAYLLIIIRDFFFRDFSYSYIEYYFNTFLIVTSISIMLQFYTGNDKLYFVPIALSVFVGVVAIILGLTQSVDQLMGGLTVFLGIGTLLIGIINIPLKKVYDQLFFPHRKQDTRNNDLILTFFIFFLYMLMFSRTLLQAFSDVGSGAFLIIIFIVVLNILYMVFNWLLKRYSKEHTFDIIYSVLLAILGISSYIAFAEVTVSNTLVNLSIIFLSLLLYVCLILIRDIFRIINE